MLLHTHIATFTFTLTENTPPYHRVTHTQEQAESLPKTCAGRVHIPSDHAHNFRVPKAADQVRGWIIDGERPASGLAWAGPHVRQVRHAFWVEEDLSVCPRSAKSVECASW
ncbi:hypothetical protein PM082_006991 [Marasmius tenuissimus]|nr:hypothetical protein PM082_006991 [Marasmius tenuissimus]